MDLFSGDSVKSHDRVSGPSIIYQGLYIPDARFNTFADGIITNMVSQLRSDNLDPVYFRINGRGSVT